MALARPIRYSLYLPLVLMCSGLASVANDGEAQGKKDSANASSADGKASANRFKASASSKDKQGSEGNSDVQNAAKQQQMKAPAIDLNALKDPDAASIVTTNEGIPTDTAATDQRKPLIRSPRTRAILDDHNESTTPDAKSKSREALEASPKKEKKKAQTKKDTFGGLKTLRSRKDTPARESSGDRQHQTLSRTAVSAKEAIADAKTDQRSNRDHGDSEHKQSSSSSRRMDVNMKPDGTESNALEQQENEKTDNITNQSTKKQGTSKQTKSSLSPLRRRKQDQDSRAGSSKEVPGSRLKLRDLFPVHQPEVHIVGDITSGEGFGRGGFACKWGIEYGSMWHHIAGDQLGQTQIDYPLSSTHPIIWSHPIDLHFAAASFQGWPKLLFQVWQIDTHMKSSVAGYGFIHLPFSPGEHHLSVALWRPIGSAKEELEARFLGHTPELVTDEVVFNSAWAERCRLQTIATGKVHLQVGILLRNFEMLAMEM
ncbi:B9 domain-containing protein 2, partial [Globisporangium splendens]